VGQNAQLEVVLHSKLTSHWEVKLFNLASPKHDKHLSGRFYPQVAQLSLHLKMHFVAFEFKVKPGSHLEQVARAVHSIQLTKQAEHFFSIIK
jgi:hypothetical protein